MEKIQQKKLIIALNDEKLFNQILEKRPVFFLDYDGTLTPIVNHPEDALLSDSMRSVLKKLAKLCKVSVISGRDKKDVQKLVGLDELIYAGSHGFDISGPGGMKMQNEEAKKFLSVLDKAEEVLKTKLSVLKGSQLERKKFSIAIHYRNAAEDIVPQIKSSVYNVHEQFPNLRKGFGKKVIELQPDIEWHKGKAVLWLMDYLELKRDKVLPFYIGDDITDEDAFNVLQNIGIGILVGDQGKETKAHYLLNNVGEVEKFLNKVIERIKK
jgi:trehalose 6-phosphate phosphatase